MSDPAAHDKLRFKKPVAGRRRAVAARDESPVSIEPLTGGGLPLVVRRAAPDADLFAWAGASRALVEERLLASGGLLFRGFGVETAAGLNELMRCLCDEPMTYQEPTSPRTHVGGHVYTSTDYPASERIMLHNEDSYAARWPLRLFFCCAAVAEEGGETPIADSRRVYRRLDARVRERFVSRQVMYVRNFGDGLGIPWQQVFDTDDPARVDEYCRRHNIEAHWKDGRRLRIRYVYPAVARHPRTRETVWFNHVALFHISSRDPVTREALLATHREEDLPYNAYYGDGSRIEPSEVEAVLEAYAEETVIFGWQPGDVLVLDNMLAAHGRQPFRGGGRRILVGMAEPVARASVESPGAGGIE